jgi:hypothetical protein
VGRAPSGGQTKTIVAAVRLTPAQARVLTARYGSPGAALRAFVAAITTSEGEKEA